MKCLVTGSAGFLGRHFMRYLEGTGHQATGLDTALPRTIVDHQIRMDCRTLFKRDMRDSYRSDYDLVIHCAATIPPLDERTRNGLSVADDFCIDAEMFQWARVVRPRKIVYFSSCAAYPQDLMRPIHEDDIDLDDIRQPGGMYGLTKLVGEVQAREAIRDGLDVLVVRPFSGYGEDQSPSYPFPSLAARAARQADPFEVWGSGRQVRDWIHVDDIVGAVMRAVELNIQGPINLGWGTPITFMELAHYFISVAQYEVDPPILPLTDMPTGMQYRCADASKMFSFYSPKVTLAEGIVRAVATSLHVPEWSNG